MKISRNKCSSFLLLSVVFSALLLSGMTQALQYEANFKVAYRYSSLGLQLAVIQPDTDGDYRNYLAQRYVYGDINRPSLVTQIESGNLERWLDDSIQPKDWTNYTSFTIYSTRGFEYDNYGRKIKEWIKGTNGTIEMLSQYTYNAKGLVQCKARRMNKAVYSSLPSSACSQSTAGSEGPDRITRYTYDELDQVLTEERGVGAGVLQQVYVTNTYEGKLLRTQTDANGNKTSLIYDSYDRLQKRIYPSKVIKGEVDNTDFNQYAYDLNGNMTWERKRNAAQIYYYYDNNNRLRLKDYANNSQTADIYYKYDSRGITLHSRFGSHTGEGIINTADGFGNIIRTDTTMGGTTRTLKYTYDANNNRTHVYHSDNISFKYDFDGLNRVNRLSEGSTPMLNLLYNPQGRRSALLRNYNSSNGTVATRTNYNLDNALRLGSLVQDFPNTGLDLTNTFIYNPVSQITQLTQSNSVYQYTGNETRSGAYAVNGLNQYTSVNGQTALYDANGNLTNDNGTLYSYDDENRLRGTSGMSIAASTLKYDPLGRLYETTINGIKTTFLYDGDALVAEYNSANALTKRYVHGDQVDEPWVQYETAAVGSGNWRYIHADHQGSVIAYSTSAGALSGSALSYDTYGIPKSTNTGRFGYTGQAWLKELGLFHYKARVYSPRIGRFLQTDPIGYADNMNMYAYVGGDPMNYQDPTGMYECSVDGDRKTCEGTSSEVKEMSAQMKGYKVDGATSGFTSDPVAMQNIIDGHAVSQMRVFGPQSKSNEFFGFIHGKDGKLDSSTVKGGQCRDGAGTCTMSEAKLNEAKAGIPSGSKVFGEWHTHNHKGSPALSEADANGAYANRNIKFYSAYYADPNGNMYRWDANKRNAVRAGASKIYLGNYNE